MYKHVVLSILLSIVSHAPLLHSADTINHIATVPNEALAEIIAFAYIDYDDPVEFTRLKSVCTAWRAIINEPFFKKSCVEKEFAEPVMVFYELGLDKRGPDTLKTDIYADQQGNTCDEVWPTRKTKVTFRYIDPSKIAIDTFEGIFCEGAAKYLAIWVNPLKTCVFNNQFALDSEEISNYYASKMSLVHYIKQQKNGEKLESENKDQSLELVLDPVIAEPILILKDPCYYASYTRPAAFIDSPISASRLVKKWPSTITFKQYQHNADYLFSNNVRVFDSSGFLLTFE